MHINGQAAPLGNPLRDAERGIEGAGGVDIDHHLQTGYDDPLRYLGVGRRFELALGDHRRYGLRARGNEDCMPFCAVHEKGGSNVGHRDGRVFGGGDEYTQERRFARQQRHGIVPRLHGLGQVHRRTARATDDSAFRVCF